MYSIGPAPRARGRDLRGQPCNAARAQTTVVHVPAIPPTAPGTAAARAGDRDAPLLAGLRAGDERAFVPLVTRYHASLKRVARAYVGTDAVAEDVVQETWLAVIGALDRFEQRATLKTWLFHILTNKAKTRGVRERRSVPFASLARAGDEGPAVSPDRFQREGDAWPGHWATPPRPWEDPERRLAVRPGPSHPPPRRRAPAAKHP